MLFRSDIVEYHSELNLFDIDKMIGEDFEPTDDELFGQPSPARRIAKWLDGFANTMRDNPAEISGLSPEDGDEYLNDLEEIREEAKTVRFVAKAFERQGIVAGLRAWVGYSNDWWENFEDNMMVDTGVNLSELFDKYDDQLRENTEPSDDELFGEGLKPMSEVLGFLNELDYDELIDQGFEFGGYPEHDRAVLDDYLEYKGLSVLTVRFNPDNEDDPLVRVVPRNN
mgnify:CR=1 FL=1